MIDDIVIIGIRDGLIWFPIILGFGLLFVHLRHIDVGLDGVVVLAGITSALIWNLTESYLASIAAAVVAACGLSLLCACLNGILGIPQLMVGIVFSLTAHALSVNWIGESVRLHRTEFIVGRSIPWSLAALAIVLVFMSRYFYGFNLGRLIRKLGDGVRVNSVLSPATLTGIAYGFSGALYGLGAAFYTHKIGSARAGGGFEFLIVSVCSFLCVSRLTTLVRNVIAHHESRINGEGSRVFRFAELVASPEANAIAGALLYASLVPIVLLASPNPTSWKLVLAGCLILALINYSFFPDPTAILRRPRLPPSLSALTIDSLTFAYSEGPIYRLVFENAHATFARGLTLVKGANGMGKSTLLRIISGQIDSYSGVVAVDGKSMDLLPSQKRPVFFVTQNPFLTIGESLTVYESLSTSALLSNAAHRRIPLRKQLEGYLDACGFTRDSFNSSSFNLYSQAFWMQRTSKLSGGQGAVVAVLASLMSERPVLLFDEPSTGLDDYHFGLLMAILAFASRDRIVVVATHDNRLNSLATEIIRVGDGACQEEAENGGGHGTR